MLNKAQLIGRLGKAPELRYTTGGSTIASFSIATDYRYMKDDEWQSKTTWHNISAWGKLGERVNQKAKKGTLVFIDGRIDNSSFEDRGGNKKYRSGIVADRIIYLKDSIDTRESLLPSTTPPTDPMGGEPDLPS
ncbi:MAG: single-stranded DNA-binding protein [Candidatus Auribacterota bacterium]|nr:single-stranded DNA-binding protein [Candidatus Auribacterota bacterium]